MSKTSTDLKKISLAFLCGAATGYIASLFVPSETKHQQKEKIEETAERVKDIFDENTAEMRAKYHAIREEFIAGLSRLKGTVSAIDKAKYQEVLDEVLKKIKSREKLPKGQIDKLRHYLSQDFQIIKQSLA